MSFKVAFAVNRNNEFEKKHFGDAHKYVIYQWQDSKFTYQTELINQSKNLDESNEHGSKIKGNSIISVLNKNEANILVSRQYGKNIKMVNKYFVPVIISVDTIDEVIHILLQNMNWIE